MTSLCSLRTVNLYAQLIHAHLTTTRLEFDHELAKAKVLAFVHSTHGLEISIMPLAMGSAMPISPTCCDMKAQVVLLLMGVSSGSLCTARFHC